MGTIIMLHGHPRWHTILKEVSRVILKSHSDVKGMRELKQKGEKSLKNGPIVENNTVPNKRTNFVKKKNSIVYHWIFKE